jgi:hypothetical protein
MAPGTLIALSVLACVAVAAALAFVMHTVSRPASLPVTADWIEELSLDRYRPMLRLLDEQEFRQLRSQPGFTPAMASQLRRQRCRVFRGYLRSLSADFSRVCLALKLLMIQAGEDRADLASTLVRTQIAFACGMALVQVRLALFSVGVGTVEAASLLKVFDGLRLELRTLVPATMTAGV